MRQRNRAMYQANNSYCWQEMENEFARTAEAVHVERKYSGEAVKYAADYFYHGCNRPDRAVEVMADATIGKLKARPWPPHFGDAPSRIADLERQHREAKKQ